jgi:hypothetical protein
MAGMVALLGVAVLIERSAVSCWQESISAYYYTPVRAVFVGGLVAIGLCLIVIKGSTPWEDAFLNVAGMLAPVVAFVPTTNVGTCWSVDPPARPVIEGPDGTVLAPWVVANIDNNIEALLITGFAGLVIAALIATYARRSITAIAEVGDLGMRLGLAGTMVLIVAAALAHWLWDGFATNAHDLAAYAMFGALGLAVGSNALQARRESGMERYVWAYSSIAAGMVLALVVLLFFRSWSHWVLVLEAIEITLFAAFWLVQTVQHWDETV